MSAVSVTDEHGRIAEHCFQLGDDPRARRAAPQTEQDPAPVKFTAQPAQRRHAQPSSTVTVAQLLKQLRARLRVVEREIKSRQKLEEERSQIKRLIAAALADRDNVRRLRSTG